MSNMMRDGHDDQRYSIARKRAKGRVGHDAFSLALPVRKRMYESTNTMVSRR
jgi:hypothetical protein